MTILSRTQVVVFTDLDGTLLNHNSYEFGSAAPFIDQLINQNVQVIFNTSKTFEESEHLQKKLNLAHPMIIENGSAIAIPKYLVPAPFDDWLEQQNHYLIPLGPPITEWRPIISKLKAKLDKVFDTFSDLTAAEVANLTNLSIAQATRAKNRQFSEVIVWRGSDVQKAQLIKLAREYGGNIVAGGRFLHLLGDSNKGKAAEKLLNLYRQLAPQAKWYSIAIGDSYNDIDMLERADVAIQIPSPKHAFPKLQRSQVIQAQHIAPKGWVESLKPVIQAINKESHYG